MRTDFALRSEPLSSLRRAQERDCLAFVAPEHAEVSAVDRNHYMFWKKFAHSHQAQIGEVGLAIGVPVCETCELHQVVAAVERRDDESLVYHCQHDGRTFEMEGGLRKRGLAGQQGLSDIARYHPRVLFRGDHE